MLLTNTKLPEITFKCKQHAKKAEAFCKYKFCAERLLCPSCQHSHTDVEPIEALFAFSNILKREYLMDDNAKFVNGFMVSMGDVFRSIKSTEESLLWLHQMMVGVSEASAQMKAAFQSLQLLSIQLTSFLTQYNDVKHITDSRQLSELIDWYISLRSTLLTPQTPFDERDCEIVLTMNQEIISLSQALSEKVSTLAQKFNIMKRGGTLRLEQTANQIPISLKELDVLKMLQPQVFIPTKESMQIETVPKAAEKKVDASMNHKENFLGTQKSQNQQTKEIPKPETQKNAQEKTKNQIQNKGFVKTTKAKEPAAVKPREEAKLDPQPKENISSPNVSGKEIDNSSLKKLFEGNQKETLETVMKWLQDYENSKESHPGLQEEAQKYREEVNKGKELLKISKAITGKTISDPMKTLKKTIFCILQDLMKSSDDKSPAIFLGAIHRCLENKREQIIEEFKQKQTEEEIRELISKLKDSRIDCKSEYSKLIEICLEYQLRLGKIQPELEAVQKKTIDFAAYQNMMEKFCRLKLMPPNYEPIINQFFEVKAAQVHLEFFATCLQRIDLSGSLQRAYSNDTNELDARMIFQRLQEISLNRAKEMKALVSKETEIKCSFGESYEELEDMIAQADNLQKKLEKALKNYESDHNREQLLSEGEKCFQSALFFDELIKLRPFHPKIAPKTVGVSVRQKRQPIKAEHKTIGLDSEEDGFDDGHGRRKNKKLKQEEGEQSIGTRGARTRGKATE